jgi:hypothetical protein
VDATRDERRAWDDSRAEQSLGEGSTKWDHSTMRGGGGPVG